MVLDREKELRENLENMLKGKTIFLENRIVYTVKEIEEINVISGIIFVKIIDKMDNIVDINYNNIIKIQKKRKDL